MGTIPGIFPKELILDPSGNGLATQSSNIGFKNMMAAPGNDDSFDNIRLKCNGVNTVCETKRFVGGQPTGDWDWTEATKNGVFNNQTCQHALDNLGDPCKVQGRGLPTGAFKLLDFKTWTPKNYIVAGSIAVALIGTVIVLTRKTS